MKPPTNLYRFGFNLCGKHTKTFSTRIIVFNLLCKDSCGQEGEGSTF